MPAIKATLTGLKTLDKALKRAEIRARAATRVSVDKTSRKIQLVLRNDVGRIFTKNKRASNAVRRKLFNNKSRGTAALIFSKFGRKEGGQFVDFLGPYITGTDIRPKRGRFLVIPLQRGKRNRDPKTFKNLRTVNIAGKLFLVRSTRTRTTFMFLLVPRIKITKRIRAVAVARREARRMGEEARNTFRF